MLRTAQNFSLPITRASSNLWKLSIHSSIHTLTPQETFPKENLMHPCCNPLRGSPSLFSWGELQFSPHMHPCTLRSQPHFLPFLPDSIWPHSSPSLPSVSPISTIPVSLCFLSTRSPTLCLPCPFSVTYLQVKALYDLGFNVSFPEGFVITWRVGIMSVPVTAAIILLVA